MKAQCLRMWPTRGRHFRPKALMMLRRCCDLFTTTELERPAGSVLSDGDRDAVLADLMAKPVSTVRGHGCLVYF
jgi:hypothetical protein